MIPINPRQHLDPIIQPPRRFRRLLINVIPIIHCLIPQKRHKAQSHPNNHKIDPKRRLPWLEIRNDGRKEGSEVRRDDERPCPNPDLARVFMEEEHVVNEAETNCLGCGGEESLETPGGDEGDPIGGKDGEEGHPEGQEHCPPKNRDPTESLGEWNGYETAHAKHLELVWSSEGDYKDIARQRATGVVGGDTPINGLRDDQGYAPCGSHIGDNCTKRNHE
jgi:hypothetical protein